jgi:hypothetical protein
MICRDNSMDRLPIRLKRRNIVYHCTWMVCRRITLTSDSSWDPKDSSFAIQEKIVSDRMDPIVHEVSLVDRIVPCPELMSVRELG